MDEEEIETSSSLTSGLGFGEGKTVKLKGRVMVYTGYEYPNAKNPYGQVTLYTKNTHLETRDHLPYGDHPRGPSTGIHFFRWGVLPGRFWGRAFIEKGIGPQQIRNKRFTQLDAIIDRGLPKTYIEANSLARSKTGEPFEYIEVNPGAPLPQDKQPVPPGAWMIQDIKLNEEALEKALGLSSITTGQPPQGVSAYSALALLNENSSLSLDPVAQDLRMRMNDLAWDTMEAMRNWPSSKEMLIAGSSGQPQVFEFNSNTIPPKYLVHPPRGGALPRSQAAELQKIDDIWNAARASGTSLPLSWYVDSKNEGKAQELPPSISDQQSHLAELENVAMEHSGVPAPVHDYDNDAQHVQIHRAFQLKYTQAVAMGDTEAQKVVDILEQHNKEHEQSAAMKSGGMPAGPGSPAAANPSLAPRLPAQNLPQGGPTTAITNTPNVPPV